VLVNARIKIHSCNALKTEIAMAQISIEMITKGEPTIEYVLKSIQQQSFRDYDVTCVNSSENPKLKGLLKEYGVNEIRVEPHTKHLEARYLAHVNSSGKFRLLLDSTRPLRQDAFEVLITQYANFEAVCIKEGSLGLGFWVRQAEILSYLSGYSDIKDKTSKIAYVLPRFYREEVLTRAFKFIKENIDDHLFADISYGEHHLIYDAARVAPDHIGITDETLIDHFEDASSRAIFRKYLWYGKSQKTLNQIKFNSNAKNLISHKRPFSTRTVLPKIKTIPIRFLRTSAFIIGYFF